MIDYKTNDPRGWGGDPTRGAALGRPTIQGEYTGQTLFITRKQLDGDYDENGTYFGQGEPLFWVHSEDGEFDYMIRAGDIEKARKEVKGKYPEAKIAGDSYNVSLDRDTLQWLLEGEIESAENDSSADVNDEIMAAAAEYEAAVLKVLGAWIANNLSKMEIEGNGIEPDENGLVTEEIVRQLSGLRGGAAYLYYMEAEGSGVGTWDGEWDYMFKSREAIGELSKVVKQATHSEYYKLKNALVDRAQ